MKAESWDNLTSLIEVFRRAQASGWKFEDTDLDSDLKAVAERIVNDLGRKRSKSQFDFLNDVVEGYKARGR